MEQLGGAIIMLLLFPVISIILVIVHFSYLGQIKSNTWRTANLIQKQTELIGLISKELLKKNNS